MVLKKLSKNSLKLLIKLRVLGIGVDIIDNLRIKKNIKKKKFLLRIFSKHEINRSLNVSNKSSFFSKRYSAKEAFSKALGTGFRNGLNYNDISINNDQYGKPYIKITKKLSQIITKRYKTKKINVFLSISDEKKHSISFVVIGKKWF